jgi:uncharacterized protein (UPF0262 family)
MQAAAHDPARRIIDLALDEKSVIRRSPEIENERSVAITDLLADNYFWPIGATGPFRLSLGIQENRLVLDIAGADEQAVGQVALPLAALRRHVKDYFTVCESYYAALKKANPAQIEALDMGRRGLHNESAELLRERLADRVEMDLATARRLFTLICVLHIKV